MRGRGWPAWFVGFVAERGIDQIAYRLWRLNPLSLYRRFRHRRFDRRHDVATGGYGDLRYEPTPEASFEAVMTALKAIQPSLEEFTFIDIGSGKGKVLLLAADHPFKRVLGVEKFEDLHAVGVDNLERVSGRPRQSGPIATLCLDAAEFEFPDEPSVAYLFNPFAIETLKRVLENLERSLTLAPRELYVLFYAPILKRGTPWDRRAPFDNSPRLEILTETRDYTIYRSSSRND